MTSLVELSKVWSSNPSWTTQQEQLAVQYDVLGNIANKSDVGAYLYNEPQPHASSEAGGVSLAYDQAGNQIARGVNGISYTAFDLPETITLSGGNAIQYRYDANQGRAIKNGPSGQIIYGDGLYEVRENGGGASEVSYVFGAGRAVVARVLSGDEEEMLYLHDDHLGSIVGITGADGALVGERRYDAYGNLAPGLTSLYETISRGYTGHEDEPELGFVNMIGRIYDPSLGRFLTPDPFVQYPMTSQSWNRYAYALNDPLTFMDPTGFTTGEVFQWIADTNSLGLRGRYPNRRDWNELGRRHVEFYLHARKWFDPARD